MISKEDFIELPILLSTYERQDTDQTDEKGEVIQTIVKIDITVNQTFRKSSIISYRCAIDSNTLSESEDQSIIELGGREVYLNMSKSLFEKIFFIQKQVSWKKVDKENLSILHK